MKSTLAVPSDDSADNGNVDPGVGEIDFWARDYGLGEITLRRLATQLFEVREFQYPKLNREARDYMISIGGGTLIGRIQEDLQRFCKGQDQVSFIDYIVSMCEYKLANPGKTIFSGRAECCIRKIGTFKLPDIDAWEDVVSPLQEFRTVLRLLYAKRGRYLDGAMKKYNNAKLMLRLRNHNRFISEFDKILDEQVRKAFPVLLTGWPDYLSTYPYNIALEIFDKLPEGEGSIRQQYRADVESDRSYMVLHPNFSDKNLRKCMPMLFWNFLDGMIHRKVRSIETILNKAAEISVGKHSQEYRDWIRDFLNKERLFAGGLPAPLNILSCVNYREGVKSTELESRLARIELFVNTEGSYFPHNLVDDRNCSTCVLGPTGDHKKVSTFYEADPYCGTMWLGYENDKKRDKSDIVKEIFKEIFGFAPFFECVTKDGKKVLLCDGVDAGPLKEFFPAWREVFYEGIIAATKSAAEQNGYEEILFNQFVTNASSREFNDYVRQFGLEEVMYIEKIGGNQPLEDAGFPKGSKHFIESLQYRENGEVGTMWSKECKGKVHVVRVNLNGA
jgi:hypothetical protein